VTNVGEIFKTISIGGVSKETLIQQLVAAGVQFNENAKKLFERDAFAPPREVTRLNLVKLTPAALGLGKEYSYDDVIAAGERVGLKLCPFTTAAFLRLAYLDQPEGPYLTIVSSRTHADEEAPLGFYLRNNDGHLWLRGYRAIGATEWPAGEFVFLE
jgi:hypothetical protein